MKLRIIQYILLILIGITGYTLLFNCNWKIAIGIFLIQWSINLENALKNKI